MKTALGRIGCAALALAIGRGASAQAPLQIDAQAAASKRIQLEEGTSRLLIMNDQVIRVSVANPDVADVKVITATQLLLTAKAVGATDLTVWNRRDEATVFALQVGKNLEELRRQIKELFPEESIQVQSAGKLLVLSGEVQDLRVPARALALARLHADEVANLIRVRGNQQVQLEVRFAEVSRSGLRALGVGVFARDGAISTFGGIVPPRGGTPAGMPGAVAVPANVPGATFQDTFNLFYSTTRGAIEFSTTLSMLEQTGLAKTLAEPTLVALSGQEANFLAGGEIPVPVPSGQGQVSIQWKKFGVLLKFAPVVLDDEQLQLGVEAEVSDLDPRLGISILGTDVPGLTSRQGSTTVRLRDGQSFAIAGLLSDRVRAQIDKVPLLGDLPILGALFRSTRYQRDETELLVVVTTRLVRPMSPEEIPPLPGEEESHDPDDFELFLLGRADRVWGEDKAKGRARGRGEPAGRIGFSK